MSDVLFAGLVIKRWCSFLPVSFTLLYNAGEVLDRK